MPSIDYVRVKQMIPLGEVVRLLGIPWSRISRSHVRARCPLCVHPDPRACLFNGHFDLFYCHRCKRGGSALDLYAGAKRMSLYDATVELCQLLHRELPLTVPVRSLKDRAVKDSDSSLDADV